MRKALYGTYFCGNEASDYAKENGYLDYATLAKAFDAVLNNEIMQKTAEIGYWEQISGFGEEDENGDYYEPEIYQYFIISDAGAEIIENYTNDPLFYNEELDMYVWGVTHYGTAWTHVLTDIKLNAGEEAFKN